MLFLSHVGNSELPWGWTTVSARSCIWISSFQPWLCSHVWGSVNCCCTVFVSGLWIKQKKKNNKLKINLSVRGLSLVSTPRGMWISLTLCALECVLSSPTQWGNAVTRILRINQPKHTYQPQWSEWLCNCTFIKFTAEKCSNRLSGMGLQRLQVKGAWVTALLTTLQYFLDKFIYRFLTCFFLFFSCHSGFDPPFILFFLYYLKCLVLMPPSVRFTPIYNLKISSVDMADEHLATMLQHCFAKTCTFNIKSN